MLNSCGTIDVVGNEHHLLAFLCLQVIGEFGGKGRLTRTLQTGEKDDSRIAFEVEFGGFGAHEGSEFVVGDLDHQLPGTNSGHDVLSEGFCLNGIGELLGSLVVNVRLQQGFADILNGFGDVDLGNSTLAFQYLKRPFKSFA